MARLAGTARLFRLLSDKNRLRLLKLIEHEQSFCAELALVVGLSYSTVCRHLKFMTAAGLIHKIKSRYRIYYTLAPKTSLGGKLARMACAGLEDDKRIIKDKRVFEKDKYSARR